MRKQVPEVFIPTEEERVQAISALKRKHRSSNAARLVMPLLFISAALALIFGVWKILKSPPEQESSSISAVQPPAQASAEPNDEENSVKLAGVDIGPPVKRSLPTPRSEQPVLIEPPPPIPAGLEAISPGMEALAVLERFLEASSLEERLAIIETKTPADELAQSILARPLPPVRSVVIDAQESNIPESVVDYFYNVDFEGEDMKTVHHTLLVRSRGSSAPKVVVDPFLDMFGGRLAAFAAQPTDKAGVFQVLVYPVAACLDPNIRDRDKKRTLKLLARDNTREIALAHFGKHSEIAEMLQDGTYSLSYGKTKACTVMLDWNTRDHPEHPYLEAVKIVALDWNP